MRTIRLSLLLLLVVHAPAARRVRPDGWRPLIEPNTTGFGILGAFVTSDDVDAVSAPTVFALTPVDASALSSNVVIAGGLFSGIGGTAAASLAYVSATGSGDAIVSPLLSEGDGCGAGGAEGFRTVSALLMLGADVLAVGGSFLTCTTRGVTVPVNRVALINLTSGLIMPLQQPGAGAPGVDATVNALALRGNGSELVIAGSFTRVIGTGGVLVGGVVRFRFPTSAGGAGGAAGAAGPIYRPDEAGAAFDRLLGVTGYAGWGAANETGVTIFNGSSTASIRAVAVWGAAEDVLLAGSFAALFPSGRPAPRVVRWDAATQSYSAVPFIATPPPESAVLTRASFMAWNGSLHLGASITSFGNLSLADIPQLFRLSESAGPGSYALSPVPMGSALANPAVTALQLAVDGSLLIVGGRLPAAAAGVLLPNGTASELISAAGAKLQSDILPCGSCRGTAVAALPNGDVWIGGELSHVGVGVGVGDTAAAAAARYAATLPLNGLARYYGGGRTWQDVASGGNGVTDRVRALAAFPDTLFVGGLGRFGGASAASRLIRWAASGNWSSSSTSTSTSTAQAVGTLGLAYSGGIRALLPCPSPFGLVIGGSFLTPSQPGYNIGALTALNETDLTVTGWLDNSSGVRGTDTEVRSLAFLPAGSAARLYPSGASGAPSLLSLPSGAVLFGGRFANLVKTVFSARVDVEPAAGVGLWTGARFLPVPCADGSPLLPTQNVVYSVVAIAVWRQSQAESEEPLVMVGFRSSAGWTLPPLCGGITSYLAQWRPSTGEWRDVVPLSSTAGSGAVGVFALTPFIRNSGAVAVAVGGRFTHAGGAAVNHTFLYDPASGNVSALADAVGAAGVRAEEGLFAEVRAIAASPDFGLILGGAFDVAGRSTTAQGVVLWQELPLEQVQGQASATTDGTGTFFNLLSLSAGASGPSGVWGASFNDSSAEAGLSPTHPLVRSASVDALALLPASDGRVTTLAVGGSFAAVGLGSKRASHVALFDLASLPLPTPSPSVTPSGTPSPSVTPSGTGSSAPTPSETASGSATASQSPTMVPASASTTASASLSSSPSSAASASASRTAFPSASASAAALVRPTGLPHLDWPAGAPIRGLLGEGDTIPCPEAAAIAGSSLAPAALPPLSAPIETQLAAAAAAPQLMTESAIVVAGARSADILAALAALANRSASSATSPDASEAAAAEIVCNTAIAASDAANTTAWLYSISNVSSWDGVEAGVDLDAGTNASATLELSLSSEHCRQLPAAIAVAAALRNASAASNSLLLLLPPASLVALAARTASAASLTPQAGSGSGASTGSGSSSGGILVARTVVSSGFPLHLLCGTPGTDSPAPRLAVPAGLARQFNGLLLAGQAPALHFGQSAAPPAFAPQLSALMQAGAAIACNGSAAESLLGNGSVPISGPTSFAATAFTPRLCVALSRAGDLFPDESGSGTTFTSARRRLVPEAGMTAARRRLGAGNATGSTGGAFTLGGVGLVAVAAASSQTAPLAAMAPQAIAMIEAQAAAAAAAAAEAAATARRNAIVGGSVAGVLLALALVAGARAWWRRRASARLAQFTRVRMASLARVHAAERAVLRAAAAATARGSASGTISGAGATAGLSPPSPAQPQPQPLPQPAAALDAIANILFSDAMPVPQVLQTMALEQEDGATAAAIAAATATSSTAALTDASSFTSPSKRASRAHAIAPAVVASLRQAARRTLQLDAVTDHSSPPPMPSQLHLPDFHGAVAVTPVPPGPAAAAGDAVRGIPRHSASATAVARLVQTLPESALAAATSVTLETAAAAMSSPTALSAAMAAMTVRRVPSNFKLVGAAPLATRSRVRQGLRGVGQLSPLASASTSSSARVLPSSTRVLASPGKGEHTGRERSEEDRSHRADADATFGAHAQVQVDSHAEAHDSGNGSDDDVDHGDDHGDDDDVDVDGDLRCNPFAAIVEACVDELEELLLGPATDADAGAAAATHSRRRMQSGSGSSGRLRSQLSPADREALLLASADCAGVAAAWSRLGTRRISPHNTAAVDPSVAAADALTIAALPQHVQDAVAAAALAVPVPAAPLPSADSVPRDGAPTGSPHPGHDTSSDAATDLQLELAVDTDSNEVDVGVLAETAVHAGLASTAAQRPVIAPARTPQGSAVSSRSGALSGARRTATVVTASAAAAHAGTAREAAVAVAVAPTLLKAHRRELTPLQQQRQALQALVICVLEASAATAGQAAIAGLSEFDAQTAVLARAASDAVAVAAPALTIKEADTHAAAPTPSAGAVAAAHPTPPAAGAISDAQIAAAIASIDAHASAAQWRCTVTAGLRRCRFRCLRPSPAQRSQGQPERVRAGPGAGAPIPHTAADLRSLQAAAIAAWDVGSSHRTKQTGSASKPRIGFPSRGGFRAANRRARPSWLTRAKASGVGEVVDLHLHAGGADSEAKAGASARTGQLPAHGQPTSGRPAALRSREGAGAAQAVAAAAKVHAADGIELSGRNPINSDSPANGDASNRGAAASTVQSVFSQSSTAASQQLASSLLFAALTAPAGVADGATRRRAAGAGGRDHSGSSGSTVTSTSQLSRHGAPLSSAARLASLLSSLPPAYQRVAAGAVLTPQASAALLRLVYVPGAMSEAAKAEARSRGRRQADGRLGPRSEHDSVSFAPIAVASSSRTVGSRNAGSGGPSAVSMSAGRAGAADAAMRATFRFEACAGDDPAAALPVEEVNPLHFKRAVPVPQQSATGIGR